MNKTFALSLFAACASFSMIGCGAPGDEALDESERLGTSEQATLADDPDEGLNHFAAGPFWADDSQAAYRIMGAGPLDDGNGNLPALQIAPEYRHEVLQNAIECGLGHDQQVIDHETNTVYVGHWGLARSWLTDALTVSQRRFVTGCMAQRLNAFEAEVRILLRGRTSAIKNNPALNVEFPWDESTVWGDLFSSETPLDDPNKPPFELHACFHNDLMAACSLVFTPPGNWLQHRICDSSPVCGLDVVGPCAAACVFNTGYPVCDLVQETVHVQLRDGTCAPPAP